jgi:hypothetical protein
MKPELDYITVSTGERLYFDITVERIAHSLSKLCRYSGRCDYFYSVAEHSVILAKKVWEDTGDKEQSLSALLHDGTEAYLCDVPRPIKQLLPEYKAMESKLEAVICKKLKVAPMNEYIHNLDFNIIYDEVMVLFEDIPEWVYQYEPIGVEVEILTHQEAKRAFLDMYDFLTEEVAA